MSHIGQSAPAQHELPGAWHERRVLPCSMRLAAPPTEEALRIQQAIVAMIVASDARPWSIAEVEREISEEASTGDALAQLYAAGLIHRCGEFVFATRAAIHSDRLAF